MKKRILIAILGLMTILFVSGCTTGNAALENGLNSLDYGNEITFYKSPNCGCCSGHAAELENKGFDVSLVEVNDIASVKREHNIPDNMKSCHTAVIGDYFIEGHVPIEAITKLLQEKPDIDGIALPGMPSGSSGMPGPKRAPFKVYALKDGVPSEFMTV